MNQNLKFATNIEEQITKLVERGMVIEDIEKAKENLLDIGYFRLGFYWFPFEKSYPRKQKRDHIFKENNILYPTSLEVIQDADTWQKLKDACDKIGYCCFTPEK